MPTNEAWFDFNKKSLHVARNKKRCSGAVTIGIRRLGVAWFLTYLHKGYSQKAMKKNYSQLDWDEIRVLGALYRDLKGYGLINSKSRVKK